MTMRPPVFVDGMQVAGGDLRLALSGLLYPAGSLAYRSGSLGAPVIVAATGSPSMAVVVPPFVYPVPGAGFGSGAVPAVNDGPLTLTVAASSATNPRIDAVCVRYAGETVVQGSRGSFCEVITGNPSATPGPPLLPTNGQLLATIAVGAGATTITNAMITNARAQTSAAGGIAVSRADNDVIGVYAGQYRDRADTGNLERWNGVQWTPVGTSATTTTLPTPYAPFTAGGYPALSVYRNGDGRVLVSGGVGCSSTFTPGNANPYLVFDLPAGHRPSQERFFNGAVMLGAGASQERAVFDFAIYPNGQVIVRGASTAGRTITALSLLSFEATSFPV